MNDSSFIEKRAFPRFLVNIPLHYSESNSKKIAQAETHDIGAAGIGMVTEEGLPVGTCLEIRLRMIDDGTEIQRNGLVVWSSCLNANKYRAGIKLEGPSIKPIPIVLRTIKAQRRY